MEDLKIELSTIKSAIKTQEYSFDKQLKCPLVKLLFALLGGIFSLVLCLFFEHYCKLDDKVDLLVADVRALNVKVDFSTEYTKRKMVAHNKSVMDLCSDVAKLQLVQQASPWFAVKNLYTSTVADNLKKAKNGEGE